MLLATIAGTVAAFAAEPRRCRACACVVGCRRPARLAQAADARDRGDGADGEPMESHAGIIPRCCLHAHPFVRAARWRLALTAFALAAPPALADTPSGRSRSPPPPISPRVQGGRRRLREEERRQGHLQLRLDGPPREADRRRRALRRLRRGQRLVRRRGHQGRRLRRRHQGALRARPHRPLVAPGLAASAAPKSLAELADKRFVKVAIANPAHAPYGKAAQQAMEKAGVWAAIRPKLVYGENVQQTLQFAQSGNAEVADRRALARRRRRRSLSADRRSAARADRSGDGRLRPRTRRACNARAPSRAFVNSPDGRAIMKRYGFLLPGETRTAAAK